jgi:hypothetical protein
LACTGYDIQYVQHTLEPQNQTADEQLNGFTCKIEFQRVAFHLIVAQHESVMLAVLLTSLVSLFSILHGVALLMSSVLHYFANRNSCADAGDEVEEDGEDYVVVGGCGVGGGGGGDDGLRRRTKGGGSVDGGGGRAAEKRMNKLLTRLQAQVRSQRMMVRSIQQHVNMKVDTTEVDVDGYDYDDVDDDDGDAVDVDVDVAGGFLTLDHQVNDDDDDHEVMLNTVNNPSRLSKLLSGGGGGGSRRQQDKNNQNSVEMHNM